MTLKQPERRLLQTIAPPTTWDFIKKEDPIDICWPANGPLRGAEKAHLQTIQTTLAQEGCLQIRLHEADLDGGAAFGGCYANTHTKRAQALQKMLTDTTCQVLWAGAGGFGSLEVLDFFEKNNFTLKGLKIRPIVGFSNITGLHLWAAKNKWPSLHACHAGGNQKTSIPSLLQALTGEIQHLTYPFEVLNPDVVTQPILNSSVVGGNLSLVQRSLGSPTALDGRRRVIFLEDTPEKFKRATELLTSLARAGTFDHADAIIFGHFPIIAEGPTDPSTRDVLQHFEKITLRERRGLHIPLLYADLFGHGEINHVLPLGTTAKITFLDKKKALLAVHVKESIYA